MSLRNKNQMLAGVGFSTAQAASIEDQVTGLGALATPPSQAGASINTAGNLNVQISAAGINPGATGADIVLATYTIPASAFDVANRTASLQTAGSFGATANNKRVKIFFGCTSAVVGSAVVGGTAVADTGTVATNGGGWALTANVAKYGASGSNTQIAIHNQAQVGAAVSALLAPQLLTASENAGIIVAITANATTAATDIVFNWSELTWSN